jgi:hypothetical protein
MMMGASEWTLDAGALMSLVLMIRERQFQR